MRVAASRLPPGVFPLTSYLAFGSGLHRRSVRHAKKNGMATTSVSRRLVYIKKTKNPVAPLPKQSRDKSSDQMVGEEAKPAATFAAPPRRIARQPSSAMKFAKFGMVLIGVVCAGAAAALISNSRSEAPRGYREPEVAAVSRPAPSRVVESDPGTREGALPAVLAQRSAPTDESFRASAYARRR